MLSVAAIFISLLAGCGDSPEKDGHAAMPMEKDEASSAPGEFVVDARQQQLIGVTYSVTERRNVHQTIRTVGAVTYDESLLSDITLKFHGWIEDLRVDRSGDYVRKGDVLFLLYSPELVQTQEEYLVTYDHLQRIGGSERYDEAARRMEELLGAVRRRLAYWDVEPRHLLELERDRSVLRSLPIHSPTQGYVIEKHVVEGSHVQAGHLLYRLADLDEIWVLADVYEYELPLIELGQQASVSLSYLPGETFVGKVGYIYPYLDDKERTIKVRIELPNPGHRLRDGMYADVELQAARSDVLVVPHSAVLDSGQRQIVFLASGEGRFEPRDVTLGTRFEDTVEILAGLAEGDRIVASANFLLDSESQLAAGMRQMAH